MSPTYLQTPTQCAHPHALLWLIVFVQIILSYILVAICIISGVCLCVCVVPGMWDCSRQGAAQLAGNGRRTAASPSCNSVTQKLLSTTCFILDCGGVQSRVTGLEVPHPLQQRSQPPLSCFWGSRTSLSVCVCLCVCVWFHLCVAA